MIKQTGVELIPLAERVDWIIEIFKKSKKRYDRMFFFVMYDIENNKIRTQISKYLLREGCNRVQKSVFFADLPRNKYLKIAETLSEINDMYENNDSIFFIPIGEDVLNKTKVIGQNIDFELMTEIKSTMFI